jgi:hypothetical protein
MPRYTVRHYYTSSVTYTVEAESEEAASAIVNGSNCPEPAYEEPAEFADEMIEEEPEEHVARAKG